jgi:hypothetical protein
MIVASRRDVAECSSRDTGGAQCGDGSVDVVAPGGEGHQPRLLAEVGGGERAGRGVGLRRIAGDHLEVRRRPEGHQRVVRPSPGVDTAEHRRHAGERFDGSAAGIE